MGDRGEYQLDDLEEYISLKGMKCLRASANPTTTELLARDGCVPPKAMGE